MKTAWKRGLLFALAAIVCMPAGALEDPNEKTGFTATNFFAKSQNDAINELNGNLTFQIRFHTVPLAPGLVQGNELFLQCRVQSLQLKKGFSMAILLREALVSILLLSAALFVGCGCRLSSDFAKKPLDGKVDEYVAIWSAAAERER